MKISNLIQHLQSILDGHGDLPVYKSTPTGRCKDFDDDFFELAVTSPPINSLYAKAQIEKFTSDGANALVHEFSE